MSWFKKEKFASGGPTPEEILQHTTYLQWRSTLRIAALVDETRAKAGQLIYGDNTQFSFYPNLRALESAGLLVRKTVLDMSDEEIATTDDITIDSREKIEALLKRRNGRPSAIYKRNPTGIITRADEPLVTVPTLGLVNT